MRNVITLDPPNSQFVAAMKALSAQRCKQPIQPLAGGLYRDIRHIETFVPDVAAIIAVAIDDGITDRSRIAHLLRREYGFFVSGRTISKALNFLVRQPKDVVGEKVIATVNVMTFKPSKGGIR